MKKNFESFFLYKRHYYYFFLAWLPLLVLTILDNTAFGRVKITFIYDIEVHVRLLLALPLLIYAETIVHNRMQVLSEQFLKCNIITTNNSPQFSRILTSAMNLRNSVLVVIALIILVYTVGHWISTKHLSLGTSSWLAENNNNMTKLTPAGYWYIFISLPLFQFILLRWYFHIVIWYRFLWQISRLPLQLNSLHPDQAGGLGFLANSIYALGPFLLAHTILLSGMIFNRIWNAGAIISDFRLEIFSILIFLILIPLIPLLFFTLQMIREKRMGTLNYDVVANSYVNDFRKKWIMSASKNNTTLLGTADIQSLADLFNSYEVSNKMRVTPFSRNNIIGLIILIALPLTPLILIIIPLDKIVSQIFGLIF